VYTFWGKRILAKSGLLNVGEIDGIGVNIANPFSQIWQHKV
jgi:hypothetical protein